MKNSIIISMVFMLVFMPAVTFAEETTDLREAKIDITYIPQEDGTGLKIELENTGEMPLEAMSLKIFYDQELSEREPVNIEVGESDTFKYKIPEGTTVVEASLSRGGMAIKLSKSKISDEEQGTSTTVRFSKEFFYGRGDIYNFKFDFEIAGKTIEIEQNSKGIVELELKNTGTMDLDIDIEAESELKLNYPDEVSLRANRTEDINIEVFTGAEIGEYDLMIEGRTKHLTRTLPLPIKIRVVEKPPTEPILKIIDIIHEGTVYVGEESKVTVRMENIGLGEEIETKLQVPSGWEVQPSSDKTTIERYETVDITFYFIPKTSGTEKLTVTTDYGSKEFEVHAGRSFISYLWILLSIILLILILILAYRVYKTSKAEYEFRNDQAILIIILLLILYITSSLSFILFLWILAFLITAPILLYSYFRRKKAKEKGGLEYAGIK